MAVSADYLDFVVELLSPLGTITTHRLFSGKGIYLDGTIFAFVVDDILHFKVDAQTRPAFAAEECGPYLYETSKGTHALNSYWRAPERLFDEPDEMLVFARTAYATALRAAAKKPVAKTRPTAKAPSATPRKTPATRR